MAIKEIIGKLFGKHQDSSVGTAHSPRISSEERELMAYKERERQDRIKQELSRYRLKSNSEIIIGNTLINRGNGVRGKPHILKAKNVFKSQKCGILK